MGLEYADHAIVAEQIDDEVVKKLLDRSDVLTFEIERVPAVLLEAAEKRAVNGELVIAPSADIMRLLQNKFSQKQWLIREGFPTAPFVDCPQGSDIDEVAAQVGMPFVQKAHRDGYDGQGVQVFRQQDPAEKFWQGGAFAEQFIAERREFAVLVARNAGGETRTYPVIELEFEDSANILDAAISPARIDAGIAEHAEQLATNVVERLQGVGIFAIELFLQSDDTLLVNEISPRVHNSGHMTIEAHETSQYEQHLRAITGMPLGDSRQLAPSVMRNVLYTSDMKPESPATGATRWSETTNIHWYGKALGKSMRKMGHVTATGIDLDSAGRDAAKALESLFTTGESEK